MSCFGLKGGVGSASRRLRLDGATYHLGALVLANFGRAGDLRLPLGFGLRPAQGQLRTVGGSVSPPESAAGSCIIVIGTDIPLGHRQLGRVARRAGVGLAWCGIWAAAAATSRWRSPPPTGCRTSQTRT